MKRAIEQGRVEFKSRGARASSSGDALEPPSVVVPDQPVNKEPPCDILAKPVLALEGPCDILAVSEDLAASISKQLMGKLHPWDRMELNEQQLIMVLREADLPKPPRKLLSPSEAQQEQDELIQFQGKQRAELEVRHRHDFEDFEKDVTQADSSAVEILRRKLACTHEAQREKLLEDQASSREKLIYRLHKRHSGRHWKWLGPGPKGM